MKLLNDPRDAVTEMLQGLVSSVGHLNRLDGFPEVRSCRKDHPLRLISCRCKALRSNPDVIWQVIHQYLMHLIACR